MNFVSRRYNAKWNRWLFSLLSWIKAGTTLLYIVRLMSIIVIFHVTREAGQSSLNSPLSTGSFSTA
jgi:hypothetical protein